MKQRASLLFGLIILASVCFGFADVTGIGLSARPMGMGRAFLGFKNDAAVTLYNPAGLAQSDSFKFTSMSGTLLSEIGLLSLGAAYPTQYGTIGASYISSNLSGINLTRIVGGTVEVLGQTNYTNTAMVLTYASGLDRFGFLSGFLPANNINLGANLKLFNQSFSNQSGSLEGATGSGMDIDLSAQYTLNDDLIFGASLINILPIAAGGKFTWQKNSVVEGIPAILKLGGTYRGPLAILYSLDYDAWLTERLPGALHLGVEHQPLDVLTVRAGLDQQSGPVKVENNICFGVGIKIDGYTFDYAYHQFGDISGHATHFFSLGFVGEPRKKPAVTAEAGASTAEAQVSNIKPQVLRSFSDVPENYWAYRPIGEVASINVLAGFKDGTFRPNRPLTRADLSVMLVKAFDGTYDSRTGKVIARRSKFKDVKPNSPGAAYIVRAVEMGLLKPANSKQFLPNRAVTLPEGIAVMAKFDVLPAVKPVYESPYPGFPARHWSAGVVTAAKNAGWLDYLKEGGFDLKQPFTRAEAAYIFTKTRYGSDKIKRYFSQ